MHSERPARLTPAIADVRRAVRESLSAESDVPQGAFVLVALSGGPDSLALAAATAFEARRAGVRAGAVRVQRDARAHGGTAGGPEAAARAARYDALERARQEAGATHVLLGHTLDDQAETVLLGLARGSGPASLRGMRRMSGTLLRPLLGIRRATTVAFCLDSGLTPWRDPQNDDPSFARVRLRRSVLPVLERELGPGIAEALARSADQLAEDADALDAFAFEVAEELAEHAEAGISLSVRALASNPAALRQRLIRLVVQSEFHRSLSRVQTLEVARLVTHWHGQGPVHLPGIRVERRNGLIQFSASNTTNTTSE